MKKCILLFVNLICAVLLSAQGELSTKIQSSILTAPLSILDIYNGPNINLSYEIRIQNNSNLLSVGGYLETIQLSTNRIWENLSGYFIMDEFRFILSNNSKEGKNDYSFIGTEVIYGNQSYIRSDSISAIDNNSNKTFARYNNHRQFIGVCVNYGYNRVYQNNLTVSIHFGIGIRYNQVLNDLTIEQSNRRELGDWTVPTNWIQLKGNNFIPKFNFGVKIGYIFRKRA